MTHRCMYDSLNRLFRIGYDEEETVGSDSVVIESCWGSRSANPNNQKTSVSFMQNGCKNPDEKSVIIKRNGFGAAVDWKYQMFKWRKDSLLYLIELNLELFSIRTNLIKVKLGGTTSTIYLSSLSGMDVRRMHQTRAKPRLLR